MTEIILSCEQGNSAENGVGKFKKYEYFEFSHTGFPISLIAT